MMNKIILASLLIFATGCSTVTVSVDGLASGSFRPGKVYIEDASHKSNLEREYYRPWIESTFELSGYTVVSDPKDADLYVHLTMGMNSKERIGSSPTYSYVAPKSYNYSSNTTYGYSPYSYNTTGKVTESGAGSLQQTGTQVYSYTEHGRWMAFTCFDVKAAAEEMKAKKNPSELWKLDIVSFGESGDMKAIAPYLLSAAIGRLGKPTDGMLTDDYHAPYYKLEERVKLKLNPKSVDQRQPANDMH
jgi:hypothetical protein